MLVLHFYHMIVEGNDRFHCMEHRTERYIVVYYIRIILQFMTLNISCLRSMCKFRLFNCAVRIHLVFIPQLRTYL